MGKGDDGSGGGGERKSNDHPKIRSQRKEK